MILTPPLFHSLPFLDQDSTSKHVKAVGKDEINFSCYLSQRSSKNPKYVKFTTFEISHNALKAANNKFN